MIKAKKLFSAILSIIITALYTLGVFAGSGLTFAGAFSDKASFTLDRKDGTVKSAGQKITGKLKIKDSNTKVTYQVYSSVDEGELSFEGEAEVNNGSFSINHLKLKPHDNEIIVTATAANGQKDVQTLHIDYDSSSIKKTTLKDIRKIKKDSNLQYVDNNLLVYFEENVTDEERQEVINAVGGKCVGYINGINMWQVEVEENSIDNLTALADQLTKSDKVFYAGCNMALAAAPMATAVTPSDPWNGSTWSELNPNNYNWSVEAVQALSAWGYDWAYNHINVGICDAGVDNTHEDLTGKIFFPDAASAAENNANDDHGTHVAGIMGAIPNNNLGVTGILWDTNMYCVNWDVLVGTDANLFAGLTETVQAGAKVVNFSLGLANDISGYGAPEVNTYVISYAHQSEAVMKPLLNAGYDFIVCQSAGNGQNGYSQDAVYNGYFCSVTYTNLLSTTDMVKKINERIIIVGSAERVGVGSFMQASSSNAGSQVDICAPGVNVYSCYAGGYYGNMSGTSMASPMAAAVTALAWSVNPNLTGAEVRAIILNNTCYNVADNQSSYHPLVNTYRMVNAKLAVEAAMATMNPDYSAVNTAAANAGALDSSLYTTGSWAVLTNAVNAVNYSLSYKDQPQINAYAQAINDAIAALVYKTVSYTVEYRLNTAAGIKLAADKTGTGQVTKTVTETAAAINGYSPISGIKTLQLAAENNNIVFIYITKPEYSIVINTFKEVNGELQTVHATKPGDTITVTVTPGTNFFCGTSKIVVMYDKNFYTIAGSSTSAFTFNPENTYYKNTVTDTGGMTTSPAAAWPSSFTAAEKALYKFTTTTFTAGIESANGGFPSLMNDGKWLFSFQLTVNAGATGTGRIFVDDRWTQNSSNTTGAQYFYCCADASSPSYTGTTAMDFSPSLSLADRAIPIGVSVNFDLNGGTGTLPPAQTGTAGDAVALPAGNGITRPYYNFLGWALTADAAAALESCVFSSGDTTLYAVWSKIPVALTPDTGSATVIDQANGFIYGLEPGTTKTVFETDCVHISGSGQIQYSTVSNILGTGTKVNIVDSITQQIVKTYVIVIFGDVTGDGNITGIDAGVIVDVENYALDFDEIIDAAYIKAGDLNGDGNLNGTDAGIMVNIENYAVNINQTTGTVH